MVKKTDNNAALKRLDSVLAIYGADLARWPDAERKTLQPLLGSDSAMTQAYREAVALEKVMAHAPAGRPTDKLKQRIVDAAIADGARDARVVPISAAGKLRRRGPGEGTLWPSVAMAASFALGLYMGVAGLGTATVSEAIDLAALGTTTAELEAEDTVLGGDSGLQEGLL